MKMNVYFRILFIITILLSAVYTGSAKAAPENVIRVPEQADLQAAILQVPDEGTIELAAGTYQGPGKAFEIGNLGKGFRIRAADGARVVLDGGESHDILRFMNSSRSSGGAVVFENIIFTNGRSPQQGLAGGVTLSYADGTFVNCTFINNAAVQNGASGGILVNRESTAFFFNSRFEGNTSTQDGGGLAVEDESRAYVHNSEFINNRTNLPGHVAISAGGGIYVGNSVLRVSNSRFENNQAGYVGGGIFAIGTWQGDPNVPHTDVIISNSTFIGNQAIRDPSVSYGAPTEGGATHIEAQGIMRIYSSRFIQNTAQNGGANTNYQGILQVDQSVYQGNRALGGPGFYGTGGAISSVSNDVSNVNHRTSSVTVTNSLIQGRYGEVRTVGEFGGGIYMAGDVNATYGRNGASKMGSLAENRANLVIRNVIFSDLDISHPAGGTGGALMVDQTNLDVQNSLFMNSDASGGSAARAGGIMIVDGAIANISRSIIAYNTSSTYGGGVYGRGSTLNLSKTTLIENRASDSFGASLYTTPATEDKGPYSQIGTVENNLIVNTEGAAVFDEDRNQGTAINDMRYHNNTFYTGAGDSAIYYDSIPGYSWLKASQLNGLTIQRASGIHTPKSNGGNKTVSSAPAAGGLFAAPNQILAQGAIGESEPQPAYLGAAFFGNGTLDGSSLSAKASVTRTTQGGEHSFETGGQRSTLQVTKVANPSAQLTQSGNGPITLSWNVRGGEVLDAAIDQGVQINPAASGSVTVDALPDTKFNFYAITPLGGVVAGPSSSNPVLETEETTRVLAGKNLPRNTGTITVLNVGGGQMDWTAQSDSGFIKLINPQGSTADSQDLHYRIDVSGLSVGEHTGYITINAGEAGTQRIAITVIVVKNLRLFYAPFAAR